VETRSLRAQDGAYRWHLQQAVVLRDAEGKVLKFIGTTTDIDDQKRAEEALSQAHRELTHVARVTMMGELAASIAHEVNQPLGAVVANANACLHWLKHQPPKLDEAQESVRQIILDGNRGSEVVTGIRKLLRKEPPHGAPLKINEVAQEMIALLQAELREVTVEILLEDDLAFAVADRVQLQQVLLNLIMNAVEAMKSVSDRPRVLRIVTKRDSGSLILVAVQDSGPGLNPEQTRKLFDPFYTTKPQGLGMGLSICRSIIERYGGRLWAESNEDSGATFKFTLPCVEEGST
jgi:C4-dicarboxylate-specific signal transduction histidine kinase